MLRAMSPVRPGDGRQSPASWGLPSGVRGTGAARFGLPSGRRGMSAVGWSSHCAEAPAAIANVNVATWVAIFRRDITTSTLHRELYYFLVKSRAMRDRLDLFVVSIIVLFLELTCIRWFPSHVMFLTFFTNIVLLACFVGMSVGCLAARAPARQLGRTAV